MAKKLSPDKLKKFYSLLEARDIPGPFVYGLHDGDKVFYVGRTIGAYNRFSSYMSQKRLPIPLLRAMRRAGDALSVVILEHNPPDLVEAEKRHIVLHAHNLVNRVDCGLRMRAAVSPKDREKMLRSQMAICPHCAGENIFGGRHFCKETVDVLTPRATPEMQAILHKAGFLRG